MSTRKQTVSKVLLEFLGSMNLAITLLVAVAVASVIGTVLQQNQPYPDYIIKFGPFWFDVFRSLGLYDVYSAGWFLLMLAFLVTSTSVCIYRNGPNMLREMRHYRENASERSLRAFHHRQEWQSRDDVETVRRALLPIFASRKFRLREKQLDDRKVIVAMRGAINRLGYLFTHTAIVVICLGGLLDANVPLKVAEMTGNIQIETRDIPVSQVPDHSIIGTDNPAFRGSITIPEGSSADFLFLNVRDGYLVQQLPFRVELKDFRIEHYASGQPKSFESDLLIHDDDMEAPMPATIAVNHPLIYKGYAIYQASFGDGGSKLQMRAWPLWSSDGKPLDLEARVNTDKVVQAGGLNYSVEVDEFKLFNIFPAPEDNPAGKKFVNYGPSFTFKLRDTGGSAREYQNFMAPVQQQGRNYIISGVRESQAEAFRYLHIPADDKGGAGRFLALRMALYDDELIQQVADETAVQVAQVTGIKDDAMHDKIATSIVNVLALFAKGGFDAVAGFVEQQVPAEQQQKTLSAYVQMVQTAMAAVYVEVMRREGASLESGISEDQAIWFDDAMAALSNLPAYGSPFYLGLQSFEHREASGLQVTRAPGQDIVYLGCVMLMLGVFIMFYTLHRRYWLHLVPADGGCRVLLAGSGQRNPREFDSEFNKLSGLIGKRLETEKNSS